MDKNNSSGIATKLATMLTIPVYQGSIFYITSIYLDLSQDS